MSSDDHYLKKELYALLREDSTLFDFLQEGALDGLWYWDLEQPENEWMNSRFWEVLGYDPAEKQHKASEWQEIIFPEDLNVAINNFNKHCQDPQHPYDQVVRYHHKDGSTIWVRCRGIAIRDVAGKPIRMLGIHSDMTKQKQTEATLEIIQKELEKKVLERTNNLNIINKQLKEELLLRTLRENKLKEREERFRCTFEQAAVGIAHVTVDGRFIRVNRKFCEMLGYSHQEMLKLTFQKITHPDDLKFDQENVQRLLNGEMKSFSREKRYLKKDGANLWGKLTLSLLRDESGLPKYFIPIVEPITEQKRIEEERDRILELSQDVICILGMDGYFKYLNPAWEKILGYTKEEMMAIPFFNFIHPDDRDITHHEVERLETGKKTFNFENRYIAKDGSIHTILWTATPLVDERRFYCIGHDITEYKQALVELRRERDFSKSLIDTAQTVILVLNADGTIRSINPYMENICGYKQEEVKGKDWFETFLPHQDLAKIRQVFMEAIGNIQTRGNVNPIRTKDGREVFIEWYDKTLLDSKGKVIGLLATGQDITERIRTDEEKRKLELRLQQAQKMEAIGTLAGGIAHDFNNILAAIMGYAELVLEFLPSGSDLWVQQKEVLNAGNRARELVRQILTFSRQSDFELKPLSVHRITDEALRLLRASIPTTIEIRKELLASDDFVLADPTQIHQIVMNLCTNAYHAMRETGGILTVELFHKELTRTHPFVGNFHLTIGSYLILKVSDTGTGMNKETLDRIFDPYFTSKNKEEGTGMGLAVVHGIVNSLKGYINVHSEPGKGTSFEIYLPRIVSTVFKSEANKQVDLPKGDECILLVDDEESVLNVHELFLDSLGYRIIAHLSCEEALREFSSDPQRVDLIVTDMTMPHMTGAEFAQKALAIRPEIPIIMCSGFSEIMNEEKAKAIGIREYIMKPIVRAEMAKVVRKILDEPKFLKQTS